MLFTEHTRATRVPTGSDEDPRGPGAPPADEG
jgi:hypothetical protein